eukprot:s3012_g7.t2
MPRKRRWTRAAETTINETESCEYTQSHMSKIGDRDDGGEKLVNEIDISQGGPGAWYEMEIFSERASAESPPIMPTVKDCFEGKTGYRQPADSEDAKQLYEPLHVYTGGLFIGKLELMSVKGAEYVGKGWSEIPVFKHKDWAPKHRNEIPYWADQQSRKVNATLRHAIGIKIDDKGKPGLPCDEGAWVDIDRFKRYDPAWKDEHRQKRLEKLEWRVVLERWNSFRTVIF